MPLVSTAAQFSYAKVLFLVVLLTCFATNVATTDSISAGNTGDLSMLGAAPPSVSTKRDERSNAATITSDQFATVEERVPQVFGTKISNRLKNLLGKSTKHSPVTRFSLLSAILKKLREIYWLIIRRYPNRLWKSLNLEAHENDLFFDKNFYKWVTMVEESKGEYDVIKYLEKRIPAGRLAAMFHYYQGITHKNLHTADLAKLEKMQWRYWMANGLTYTRVQKLEVDHTFAAIGISRTHSSDSYKKFVKENHRSDLAI